MWASMAPLWASAAQCLHCEHTIPGRASTGLCLHCEHTTPRCTSPAVLRICITLIADPAVRNGADPCGSRSGSATLGGPSQPLSSKTAKKFKCNDDIHLCLLVLISPWWIGGARSEATHSPQLLMHKEKADEGGEMYFLVGFQGFPPFYNVTKGKPNYPLVDNDHNKIIYTFSYDPRFIDFLNQNYYNYRKAHQWVRNRYYSNIDMIGSGFGSVKTTNTCGWWNSVARIDKLRIWASETGSIVKWQIQHLFHV